MGSQYSVGIDLGTTNSVVAFAALDRDRGESEPSLSLLPIPQWVGPGQVEPRLSLPSFLYLPRAGEVESLITPLVADPAAGIAGHYARQQSAENPQRVVVAAKSWLCHCRVGRTDAVLPWQSPPEDAQSVGLRLHAADPDAPGGRLARCPSRGSACGPAGGFDGARVV